MSRFPDHRVGPRPYLELEQQERRATSISDPEKSSAGSKHYYSCREKATQDLGNGFCRQAIKSLFRQNPQISFATGRPQFPVIEWNNE